ncbi:MAG: hypothetical protein HY288_03450 [Planctomycetia bacterium]|nr:hypothetical protein [Planctomycetia bacterium]
MVRNSFSRRSHCIAWFVLVSITASASGDDRLRVHEWGTFTALQEGAGRALAGINIDDEPVPSFVHNLNPSIIVKPHAAAEYHWRHQMKGAPQRHPYVTMRLETPVLYFYPPASETKPFDVSVGVTIRGGWLTEFYPAAEADPPGSGRGQFKFDNLTSETLGRLAWRKVTVGTAPPGPETDAHVWTTPRTVQAAQLTVPGKQGDEHEKFLFYRGVGNIDVPLRVSTNEADDTLSLHAQCGAALLAGQTAPVPALWLVDIRRDGALAFRSLPSLTLSADRQQVLATVRRSFPDADYSEGNREHLEVQMHAALVAEGLFADEATAMLGTWQRAYFQSAGLRIFFLVPRVWTDFILPLAISRPADIERVMIARVELVSPQQRALLKKLSVTAVSDQQWLKQASQSPNATAFFAGRSDFGDLGVAIPDDYRTYLELGRFRNALVLAEELSRPTPQLRQFIKAYGLSAFRP